MITRKDAQEAKIKTRSMAKESEKKVSLMEAKRNSRQKMLLKGNDISATAVKDIYGNVKLLNIFFNFHYHKRKNFI